MQKRDQRAKRVIPTDDLRLGRQNVPGGSSCRSGHGSGDGPLRASKAGLAPARGGPMMAV